MDGDEVVLAPGAYSGQGNRDLDVAGKSVVVRSRDPFDNLVVAATVLDCEGDADDPHRAFAFRCGESWDTQVMGLTIINGYAPPEAIGGRNRPTGGAIVCVGSDPTISRCVFTGNAADRGGAIACWDGASPLITDSTFVDNAAAIDGGAIIARDSSAVLQDCVIRSSGGGGAAVHVGGSGAVTIHGCVFDNNSGSAIFSTQEAPLVSNTRVSGNETDDAGAVRLMGSSAALRNCLINGNAGGGLRMFGAEPSLLGCTVTGNTDAETVDGPVWIDTPDQLANVPGGSNGVYGFVCGYWRDKLWGYRFRRLVSFDGESFADGANTVPTNIPRIPYFNDAGAFVYSYRDGLGYLEKSIDGVEPFEIKLSGATSIHALPRSLVYCGPTDMHPGGVMFFFEYPGAIPYLYASTDNGETWTTLFRCAYKSIRHFHGGVFAPGVGEHEGRLYVLTGDNSYESSILTCDDIDDLLANPLVWKQRWGLDVAYDHLLDPAYTINDNLDAAGRPTTQDFRSVDLLIASDGYAYWAVDSALPSGQHVFRVNQETRAVERIGTENVIGSGWIWMETSQGEVLFTTGSESTAGHPMAGHDAYAHLYALTDDRRDFVELRRWIRTDSAEPSGALLAGYMSEAFGHLWVGVAAGSIEYGSWNMVGRIESYPEPRGAGVHAFDSTWTARNSIFWGNHWEGVSPEESLQTGGGTPGITYSCIGGLSRSGGRPANINADPRFVDPVGADGLTGTDDDDLRLLSDSPCINKGDGGTNTLPDETDLDGFPRILCDRIDMGAYEFGIGDENCDRVVSLKDFTFWAECMDGRCDCRAFDFDADGTIDLRDFAGFQQVLDTPTP